MKFYNSECIVLNNNQLQDYLKKRIGNDHYFGPQPISIERKHFKQLHSKKYLFSKKANGQRYMLCLVTYNDKCLSLFLNRKFDLFLVKFNFPKECFKGTFIDGEIITSNNVSTFLCFDCLTFSGKNVTNLSFPERIKHMNVLINNYKQNDTDSCVLCVKEFLPYNKNESLKFNSTYDSDGYVFMPEEHPVVFGTHYHFFKWKPLLENTIDFLINNDFKLCLSKQGNISKTYNNIVFTSFPKENIEPNKIYECKYIKEKTWSPILLRFDKTLPNSSFVYQKTLLNIKEDIQESELIKTTTTS